MAVKEDLRSFILSNYLFTDDNNALSDDQSFLETGIIDSMGVMEIVVYLEQELSIVLDDSEITPENLDSINAICHLIEQKTKS